MINNHRETWTKDCKERCGSRDAWDPTSTAGRDEGKVPQERGRDLTQGQGQVTAVPHQAPKEKSRHMFLEVDGPSRTEVVSRGSRRLSD